MRVSLENTDHENALRRQAEMAYSGQMHFSRSGVQTGKGGAAAPHMPAGLNLELGALAGLPAAEGRGAEGISAGAEEALLGQQSRQDYMTLMGHVASDEDFARMLKEGGDPSSTDLRETVTTLDRIKLALVKGGTEVAGFTDEMSVEKLSAMTGSRGFAESLVSEFAKADLPLDEETMEKAAEAWRKAETMPAGQVPDNAAAYLAAEGLSPDVDSLYTALHSGRITGRGGASYYQDASGYVTKAGELKEWDAPEMEALTRQAEKVIEEAGLPRTDEHREEAAFLIRENIPLTPESLKLFARIRAMELPEEGRGEALARAMAAAVSKGGEPGAAVFGETETIYARAVRIDEEYQAMDPELFGKDPSSFGYAPADISPEAMSYEEVDAKLALVNVQLKMTAQANLVLLRSGFSIETASLEELALQLDEAKRQLYPDLDDEQIAIADKALDTVSEMPRWPAAVSGFYAFHAEASFGELSLTAASMRVSFEKAGAAYETLMTSPRADLGDSIRTAFRNTDELLGEAGYAEPTEELRRAVRILGYNRMALSPENIERARAADQELRGLLDELKPAKLISMIREGRDPLELPLKELQSALNGEQKDQDAAAQEERSFSRFLYQLQKKQDITPDERREYMEVYRFLTSLERDDGAAIGFLLKAEAELSFGNLRSAMRSEKKRGMDYRVDESFGGLEARVAEKQALVTEVKESFTPALPSDKLPQEETTLEQFAEELRQLPLSDMEGAEAAENAEAARQAELVREAAAFSATASGEAAMELLSELEYPASPEMLFAAQLLQNSAEMLAGLQKWLKPAEINADEKERLISFELSRFTDPESAAKAEEELAEGLAEALPDPTEALQGEALSAEDPPAEEMDYAGLRELANLKNALRISVRAASREDYQIPLQTEQGAMAARVRFLKGEEKGRIRISAFSESLGRLEAALRLSATGALKAEVITDRRDILPALEERLERFSREGGELFGTAQIRTAFQPFGEPETKTDPDFIPEENAGILYRTAGRFLQAILQEVSQEAG